MKRPSFQFYPDDWTGNQKLRRCKAAHKGAWMDALCMMHDAEEYGILRCPLAEIAQATGHPLRLFVELVARRILKGCEAGGRVDAFVFTPRHAGKVGDPVTLIPEQDGPIWYSSRMVRDEYVRSKRGESTRFGESPMVSPKTPFGDGSTSTSPSPPSRSSTTDAPASVAADAAPDCPHDALVALYHELLPECPRVLEWNDARRGYMRSRWREKAKPNGVTQGYRSVDDGLAWWRKFFEYVAQSKFLKGQANGREGRPPFTADLEWLIRPKNFPKVIEGRYHEHAQ